MSESPILTVGLQSGGASDRMCALLERWFLCSESKRVEFLVVDDASVGGLPAGLAEFQQNNPDARLRLVQNRAPVGKEACWLRVFEHAQGDWVWCVEGADDLSDQALATVLKQLGEHPEAFLIGFSATDRSEAKRCVGAEQFLAQIENLGLLAETSLWVFRRGPLVGNLHAIYRYAYCGSAHMAAALLAVRGASESVFCGERIVDRLSPEGGVRALRLTLNAYLGLGTLLELPLDRYARLRLRELLVRMAASDFSVSNFTKALTISLYDSRHTAYVERVLSAASERFFHSRLPASMSVTEGSPKRVPQVVPVGDGKLTVGIPTYNRPEQIARLVGRLLPELAAGDVELLVVDNASDVPVAGLLQPILAEWPSVKARVIRNAANVGANPNILRVLEYCETEWLWSLGDDDRLAEGALGKVLDVLREHPDAAYINFASLNVTHPSRTETIETSGLLELLQKADGLGPLLFLSACAFRVDRMLPHLEEAHHLVYSCAPHLVVAFCAAREGHKAVISPEVVIDAISDGTPAALQSNSVFPAIGLPSLLEIESDNESQRRLEQLIAETRKGWLTMRSITYNLTLTAASSGNTDYALALFAAAERLHRLQPVSSGIGVKLAVARWLIAHPQVASVVETARKRDLTRFSSEVSKRA